MIQIWIVILTVYDSVLILIFKKSIFCPRSQQNFLGQYKYCAISNTIFFPSKFNQEGKEINLPVRLPAGSEAHEVTTAR